MNSEMTIRILTADDVESFLDHKQRIFSESGTRGTPIFAIQSTDNPTRKASGIIESWNADILSGRWKRGWGLWFAGTIVGSLELVGNEPPSCRHRANISIAIEYAFRRQKAGERLVQEALKWLSLQSTIEWLDFSIFEGNQPSLEFCRQFEALEVGYTPDAYRIHGKLIGAHRFAIKLQ